MDRQEKQELASFLKGAFDGATCVVVTRQTGMTVEESTDFRRQMREAGASFKITKNRIAKIALKGTKFENLEEMFIGPTGIAYSDDPVAPAKVVAKFAEKNDKMEIVGAGLDGKQLDAEGVKALAKLPSLDELRGKIIGVLQAPAGKLASVTQAPAGQLARVLKAKADQAAA